MGKLSKNDGLTHNVVPFLREVIVLTIDVQEAQEFQWSVFEVGSGQYLQKGAV